MRRLRARKGAPQTFDVKSFIALIRRVQKGGEIVYPEFDRVRDLSVADATVIAAECDFAVAVSISTIF